MRKFKFNIQLTILFVSLLLIATVLFGFIVMGRGDTVSSSQTYDRLYEYVTITSDEWKNSLQITENEEINIASIQGRLTIRNGIITERKITYNGDLVSEYLSDEDLKTLLDRLAPKIIPGAAGRGTIESDGKIFYVYQVSDRMSPTYINEFDFVIVLTDSQFANTLRENMVYQVIGVFGVVLTVSFLVLALWGGGYVTRINRIKMHIANLPKNSYEDEYTDPGHDELAELSVSIEQMRKELKQNEHTKQEMLQNLSHDFKTPIAVIKSYAEAIEDGMADASDAQIIVKQADVLQHKVTRLLEYNRLEYLEKTEEFSEVAMKEIINDIVNNYRYQTNIEFVLDLDDTKFIGYSENFYTVIDNLVDNAKRYAKTKIEISLKKGVLRVYNDGNHISDQFLNALFKPYEKGADGQFGLGMSIVKRTLDFFEYDLSVKNEEIGVAFTIAKRERKIIEVQ